MESFLRNPQDLFYSDEIPIRINKFVVEEEYFLNTEEIIIVSVFSNVTNKLIYKQIQKKSSSYVE
jgi:hypothetical protein